MLAPMRLVYSLAPIDAAFRKQLSSQLHLLVQNGTLTEWHEELALLGDLVDDQRRQAWRAADIILLLLSPDYFASRDYGGQELQEALERQRAHQVLILPILIRPCDWKASIVAHLSCLPRNERPISQWEDRDEAFLAIVDELRQLIVNRQSMSVPLTQDQRTNRQRLLKRVRKIWVEDYLEPSLRHAIWIDLHLQKEPDVTERAWSLMVQELDSGPRQLPPDTSILQVLEEADEELLILGEPGSGKTTLLAYLARLLLELAEADEKRRIPIVFNLSAWAQKRLPLTQWMIEELQLRYLVPQPLGRAWIEGDHIFALFDGLDEVTEAARAACVQAISAHMQRNFDRMPLIICCRTDEYRALSTHPPINYAIVLLPFTDEQMETYLSSISGPIDALRQALREDRELFELAHRPLMLSIFAQAYQGEESADLAVGLQQDSPSVLFRHYVKQMLRRRGRVRLATEEQMYRWLIYLAAQLSRQQQTIFAVEELQPACLPEHYRRGYRWSMPLVYALTFGVIFGPIFGCSFGFLYDSITSGTSKPFLGLSFGIIVGVIGGLIGGLIFGITFKQHQTIQPAEVTVWSWASARQSIGVWIKGGLAVGVAAAFVGSLIAGLMGGLIVGVAAIFVVGLVGGLVGGLPPTQIPEKESFSPNEGIWRSGRRGLILVLFAIILFGIAGGIICGLFSTSIESLASALILGLVLGIAGGLSFGLAFGLVGGRTGLAAFLQHFVLRFFLWRLKLLPLNLVAFLDEVSNRLLLRKLGGSYTFVHRLLRDVLAAQRNDE